MGVAASGQSIELQDEAATLELGAKLTTMVTQGIVYLHGPLGSGKTTLVRGYLRALGHTGSVKSPTYTLVEPYEFDALSIVHLDLYRVTDPVELAYIGLDELLADSPLAFVEWPENGKGYLPPPDTSIRLGLKGEGRIAEIR